MADHKSTPMEVGETVETPSGSKRVATKTTTSQPASVETQPGSKREKGPSSSPVETLTGSKQTIEASTGSSSLPVSRGSRSKAAKARKALLREGEENRVQQLLYPTTDSLAEFKRKTGKDFSASKLLDSARFAERWRMFSKNSHPTAEDRSVLRNMAMDILKKASRRAPTVIPQEPTGKVISNAKRPRADTTVSTLSSTPLGKASKIPKIKESEPQASTSKEKAPQNNIASGDDSVVDEETYDSLDFHEEESYAAAVTNTKTKWAESKMALFIHLTTDERKLMPRVTWRLFLEQFQERILKLDESDQPSPFVDFTGWSKGTGLIVAADEDSKDLIKTLVSSMEVQGHSLKAWERGERGTYVLLTCQLPESLNPTIFSGGRMLLNMATKNGLTLGENNQNLQALSCKNIAEGTSKRLLRFKVTEVVLREILQKKGILYTAGARLQVRYNGKPITDSSMEELGLE